MALIDNFYLTVESENPSFEVDVTSQPVEKGIDITDHVQPRAHTLELSGRVVGIDAYKTQVYLTKAMESGKVVIYIGRTTFKGLITSFSVPRDYKIADGFTFSLTMTEVRVAKSSYVSKLPTPIKVQAAQVVSAGVKQTKSKSKGKEKVTVVAFKEGSKWAK